VKDVVTYLNFDGQTKEAMEFYAKSLGGELFMMKGGDMPGPDCPTDFRDRIMHARIDLNGRPVLMASDSPVTHPPAMGTNFFVSLHCESKEEIQRVFAAIGEGGKVGMPLSDMFWGAHWGTVTDRFGVQWMFNYDYPKQG
jgi:PhnB protein